MAERDGRRFSVRAFGICCVVPVLDIFPVEASVESTIDATTAK